MLLDEFLILVIESLSETSGFRIRLVVSSEGKQWPSGNSCDYEIENYEFRNH